jgi:DNA-binding response OmpR family regulator
VTACDRQHARGALDERVSLIIADYHLAGDDNGLEAALALREAAGARLPVLIVTADRSEALQERLAGLGIRRLLKPVKPAALRALMRRLIDDSARG